jgi:ABC-type antimicrobial peptide transport system permease subunit
VPAGWLLALLAMATVAVVAGARMTEQEKRVGLLKAAGGGPPLTAAVLLAEHLVVALVAGVAGVIAGRLAAPLLTSPGAALAGAVRPPRRAAWLIRISGWLPVPLLLGLRLVTRRPRRVLLSAVSCTVTAATLVAVLTFHATMNQVRFGPFAGPPPPDKPMISLVLLVVTVVMAILAAANAIFTTWAAVLDTRRFSAVVRSLGATPEQTMTALSLTQLLPALAGALLGIPAGTALYQAVQSGGPVGSPPLWWLLAMVGGMLVAVAGLTVIPAWIGTRRSVSEILQAEMS